MRINLKVNKIYQGLTIKELLKEYHVGRGKIEELRNTKSVFLNGEASSIEQRINENDVLSFDVEEKLNFIPSNQSVEVVYEDEQILIVNKPTGLLIHPDGNGNKDTLVNRVARYYYDKGINMEVRYAHRIDVDTSGLVLFCKDFLTHAKINYEVEQHIIIREYRALVSGIMSKNNGVIDFSIGKDRHLSNKYRVSNSDKAKEAITHFNVIKRMNDKTLVSCILETGRTHQIRVHLSSIKHPLLGDVLYGGTKKEINRVALHSYRIKLINPFTFKEIEVTKEIPMDMGKLVGK